MIGHCHFHHNHKKQSVSIVRIVIIIYFYYALIYLLFNDNKNIQQHNNYVNRQTLTTTHATFFNQLSET